MDTAQWPQGIVVKPIEEIVVTNNTCPKPNSGGAAANNNLTVERKPARPQKESALHCPRCNSTNTKFCYYNNYSLTQPRYFCKTCRRYWTEGGSLRNIPVGGGSRKNKRSSSSSAITTSSSSLNISNNNNNSSSRKLPDLIQPPHQDLNLGFQSTNQVFIHHQIPNIDQTGDKNSSSSTTTTTTTTTASHHHHLSALELLTGLTSRGARGLTSFMPMPSDPNTNSASVFTSGGFPLSELMIKPSALNFSLDDGLATGYGSSALQAHHAQEDSGRLLFPFEDLKQAVVSGSGIEDHHHQQENNNKVHHHHGNGDSTGYWTGMLGGGSW